MDLAVGGFEKARDQPQRRGLAAAGGPEQADQLSMIDFQGDVIDHRKRSKSLGQAAQINGRQSPHSHSCSCTDQRPAWYASIRTKTGWERELERGWEMTSGRCRPCERRSPYAVAVGMGN